METSLNNWLTFVSKVIESTAWPITVIIIIVLLRKQIQGLLPALTELKYKDFQMTFGKKVEELERKVEEANLPKATDVNIEVPSVNINVTGQAPYINTNHLYTLAEVSPRSAIVEAWIMLEHVIRLVAERAGIGIEKRNLPSKRLIREMLNQKVISDDIYFILDDLRVLRNSATHDNNLNVSSNSSHEYVEFTTRVISALMKLQM